MKFLIINGPNLNLLGQREPGIYGDQSYAALCELCKNYAAQHGASADCFQSNHEGGIIDAIQAAQGVYDGIVINPGAYTHYSYAILDALKAVTVPAYEVHISHIDRREPFRAVSVTAPACVGQLYGLGLDGYLRAMDYFLGKEKLFIIGDPVGHSKSPAIQNAMLRTLGLLPCYGRAEVKKGELPPFLERVRAEGLWGFNATMPHKEDLLSLLDGVDETAEAIGSVNTVCNQGGKLYGYNTDGPGFLAALKDELGLDPKGMTVTLLGAGGAAKAVSAALIGGGAARVFVCNRTMERAAELCCRDPMHMIPSLFDGKTLAALCGKSDLLVNCTSLGMTGEFASLDFLEFLSKGAPVCDLVYEPAETALLRRARELGRPAMNGQGMLVCQAVLALEHFLGRAVDREAMTAAAKSALAAFSPSFS